VFAHSVDGLEITRVESDTRLWTGHATHYGICLAVGGAFDFWYRKRIATHAVGRLKLKEPGEVHRDVRVHEPVTAVSIALSQAWAERASLACGMTSVPHFSAPVTRGGGRAERKAARLYDAITAVHPDRFEWESLLVETMGILWSDYGEVRARAPEAPSSSGETARRVREYLHEHMREGVNLDALATAAGRSKFHMMRLFRAEYGLAPYEYLTHLRVARARLSLAAGVPAAKVAVDVGLYDQSQLHRHFKRITGMTPAAYARG